MILSGVEIERHLGGKIRITPFDRKNIGPNSYNMHLHDELMIYESAELDMAKPNPTRLLTIPPEGFVLHPNRLYLGRTVEHTETDGFVPMIEGRSSVGRLGMCIHVTAGFGDVGFCGYWTLEIFVLQPIRIYAGVSVCQLYFHTISEDYIAYASNKYQNNSGIQSSMLYKELQRSESGN